MFVSAEAKGLAKLAPTFEFAAKWMMVSMSCFRRQRLMSSVEVMSPGKKAKPGLSFSASVFFRDAPWSNLSNETML